MRDENYGNDVRNGWDGTNEGGRDEGTEFQISNFRFQTGRRKSICDLHFGRAIRLKKEKTLRFLRVFGVKRFFELS